MSFTYSGLTVPINELSPESGFNYSLFNMASASETHKHAQRPSADVSINITYLLTPQQNSPYEQKQNV